LKNYFFSDPSLGAEKMYLPFVFLIAGDEQFHIKMETLDTEEETYLWHFDRSIQSMHALLKEIDPQLAIIRNKGRQAYLESSPADFSLVLHDYSDKKRGFIRWNDILEERLV
jgi:hypothetical protein